MARTVDTGSTFENWRQNYNDLATDVGDPTALTTGSKDNLGYIPLAICNEDYAGEFRAGYTQSGDAHEIWQSRVDVMKTTSSVIMPIYLDYSTGTYVYEDRRNSTEAHFGGDQACTNLHFVVLKVPCAYGYMTSTYF